MTIHRCDNYDELHPAHLRDDAPQPEAKVVAAPEPKAKPKRSARTVTVK